MLFRSGRQHLAVIGIDSADIPTPTTGRGARRVVVANGHKLSASSALNGARVRKCHVADRILVEAATDGAAANQAETRNCLSIHGRLLH